MAYNKALYKFICLLFTYLLGKNNRARRRDLPSDFVDERSVFDGDW